ncbi:MAG: hypothetical protein GY854_06415 [Deltaproteobacteria bacterium]|nr:hypothetical protein [Deltaproteobacteria bacterium]
MQILTQKVFELGPPWGVFDETVVRNLFWGRSEGAQRAIVHRAVSSGEVLRLKPGLYCLAEPYRKAHPHPFAVAGLLHSPSHISLETALWHHALIPEAVVEVASVITARSRHFHTPIGDFSFTRVPTNYPRAGVRAVEIARDAWAFIATPLRAIADIVYTRKSVSFSRDGMGFLTDSLRIDEDDLAAMTIDDAGEILGGIRNKRTIAFVEGLLKELGK